MAARRRSTRCLCSLLSMTRPRRLGARLTMRTWLKVVPLWRSRLLVSSSGFGIENQQRWPSFLPLLPWTRKRCVVSTDGFRVARRKGSWPRKSADDERRAALGARAIELVRKHFELLNKRSLQRARRQLFFPPGTNDRPLTVYLEAMVRLAPFKVLAISISRFEEVRAKRHGDVATIWIEVTVSCALGERGTVITIWWFPQTNQLKISARPTDWVLESQKRPDEVTTTCH